MSRGATAATAAALRYQRSSSANNRAIRGAKKKLAWTLAQRALTKPTTIRFGLRGKTVSSRKIQLSTWGRASQWMLQVESSRGAMAQAIRKLPPNAQWRRNQSQTPAEIAAAEKT